MPSPTRAPRLLAALACVLLLPAAPALAQAALTNGGNDAGSIATPGEIDTWTVTAAQGDRIILSLRQPLPVTPGFTPWIRVRRPDNVQIQSQTGSVVAPLNFVAPVSGTYSVLVASGDVGLDGTGSYQLTLLLIPGAIVVPPGDEGGPLVSGANHPGTIGAGDLDAWTIAAAQNDVIYAAIGERNVPELDPGFAPWIGIYGPTGALVQQGWGQLAGQASVTAPLSGTYTIVVSTNDLGSDAYGDYVLTALKIPGTVTVSPGDQGGPLINGSNHQGTLAIGDLDAWTISAAQNDLIYAAIGERNIPELDPGFAPWIGLYGPNGVLLDSGWGQLAGQAAVTAPLSGTYTIVVTSNDLGFDAYGDYELTVVKAPGALTISQGDQGGPLTSGANHAGRLTIGDLDAWTIAANKDDVLYAAIGERNIPEDDPGFAPWIGIYGPTGALLDAGWGQVAGQASVTAPLTGTYTIVVTSNDLGFDAFGDYELTVLKMPGSLTVSPGDQGGALGNGTRHPGRIEPGDLDAWTFTAAQSDAIIVAIGERNIPEEDPGFAPWIGIYGPAGALLTSDWGQVAGQAGLTAPLTGTYTVVVTTNDLGFDASGDYELTLARMPAAFTTSPGDQGGALSEGVNHPAALSSGEVDMWTFTATQGGAITVTMAELASSPDPGFIPWLRVYRPNGVLQGSTTGDPVAQLSFTAPLSGVYTVLTGTNDLGKDASASYTVRVNGSTPPLPPPTSVADAYSTPFNTPLAVNAPGVLANDASNGGGTLTAVLDQGVASGTLAFSATGGFTFTPAAGFVGAVTFQYHAANGGGPGNAVSVTLTVNPSSPPTTVADAYEVVSGVPLAVAAPGVLVNDTANGGGALTAVLVTSVAHGSLSFSPSGAFTYTPSPGFVGPDAFSYRASTAAGGNGAIVSVALTVGAPTPQRPTEFRVASVVGNQVTLRWEPPATGLAPTGYVVDGGVTPGGVLASLPAGPVPVLSFTAPTGIFYLRAYTLAGAERSAASNEVRLVVNVPAPPSAPEGLVGLVNNQSLALAWRNTFGGGAPSTLFLEVSGAISASLQLGLTETFSFVGVPPGTYTFAVRAANSAGSAVSAPVTLTFAGPCSGAPQPPARFLAYRVGNTVFASWDPAAVGPAPTGFVLQVGGSVAAAIPLPARAISGGVGRGVYDLSVVAVNACGASAPTAVQTVIVP